MTRETLAARTTTDALDADVALADDLLARGEMSDAIDVLRAVLLRDHRHVPALIAYSRAQLRWGNIAFAEHAARDAVAGQPGGAALAQLCAVLIADHRADEAVCLLDAAIARDPADADPVRLRANAFKVLGRIDEARAGLHAAIAIAPLQPAALASLADIERFSPGDALIGALCDAIAALDAGDAQRPPLHFALGRALDQIGDTEGAFDQFRRGNALTRQRVVYDEASELAMLARIPRIFTREWLGARPRDPAPRRPAPVFIVGMPRTGSTLVEQILSRHADIACSGEILAFSEALAEVRRAVPSLPHYPDFLPLIGEDALHAVGERYRATIGARAGSAAVHVDKMLGNFLFLGAIHLALPDARFIVTRRDPRDAGLSAFSHHFDQRAPCSYDLGELGRYHAAFDRVMAHWAEVLPADRLVELRYETLVGDLEGEARRLLAFLELDWTDDCLSFHESRRAVLTASLEQVRRPLYASSVGRWRAYERHLAPFIEALRDG